MGEDTLRESLSGSGSSKRCSESKGFSDGQMGSDQVHGGTLDLFFFDDDTSSLIENLVNSSHAVSGAGDFGKENGLLEGGVGSEFTSIVNSSGGGDQLTTSSVDGIGVENNIANIDSDVSHVFIGHDGFFGGPLESIFHRVFDFIHELNSFGVINKKIGSLIFWSERPDFGDVVLFHSVGFNEGLSSFFRVIFGVNFSGFDVIGKSFGKGFGLAIKSIMFIGGFGHAHSAGFFLDGFLVGDDGLGLDDFDVGEFGL